MEREDWRPGGGVRPCECTGCRRAPGQRAPGQKDNMRSESGAPQREAAKRVFPLQVMWGWGVRSWSVLRGGPAVQVDRLWDKVRRGVGGPGN